MDPCSKSQEDPAQHPSVDQRHQLSMDPCSKSQEDPAQHSPVDQRHQPSMDPCSKPQEDHGQHPSVDQSHGPSMDPCSKSQEDPGQHPPVDQRHQLSMDPCSKSQEDPGQHPPVDHRHQPSVDPCSKSQEDPGQHPSVDQGHQLSMDPCSKSQEDPDQHSPVDQRHQPSMDPCSKSQEDPGQHPPVDQRHQLSMDPCSKSQEDPGQHSPGDQRHQPYMDPCSKSQEGPGQHTSVDQNYPIKLPGQGYTVQQTSGEYEYNAVLVFAKDDEDLAMKIQSDMNQHIVVGNQKARVCLADEPQFRASLIERPSILTEKCRFMFLMLTVNTNSDTYTRFVKNEALASTCLADKRRHFVIPLHTKNMKDRDYVIPTGLADVKTYDWFPPLIPCRRKIQELFDHSGQPEEHHSKRQSTVNRKIMRQRSRDTHGKKENDNELGNTSAPTREPDFSPDLKRIIHQTNMILHDWEGKLFYTTKATREAKDVLMTKGCLFLVGRSGDGKTSMVYHILTEFRKDKSTFQAYIVYEPEDMKHIPPDNSIVFVDDILGRSSFSFAVLEKWKSYFRHLAAYVAAGHMYFISTSPGFVRDECRGLIDDIPLLSNVIDTTSEENSLRTYEKEAMLTDYLDRYKVKMTDTERRATVQGSLIIGFPQCCQYFVTNQEAQSAGHKFFLNPFVILRSQISKLKETDRLAYMVLVLALFNNGRISARALDPYSTEKPPMFHTVMEACGDTPKTDVKSAAIKLERKKYIVYNKQKGTYDFSHQSIYDAVCLVFGDESIEKLLEFAPASFLVDHTSTFDSSHENRRNRIQIHREHYNTFINRIMRDIQTKNFKLLEHGAFTRKDFVDEFFENTERSETIRKLLHSDESVKHLIKGRTLYRLTAASKCQPLLQHLVSLLSNTDEEQQNLLLHDIMEGSCSSGDIELFDEVLSRNVTPCSKCALVAAESSIDNPYIMRLLQRHMPPEFETMETVIDILVEKQRLQTLRHVTPHVNWSHFKTPKRKRKLLLSACSSGKFRMFQLLTGPECIGDPENKNELLMTAVGGGSKDIVKCLITKKNKDQVDKMQRSVLHHACLKGSADLCQFLLSQQVDESRIDNTGATAFHLACKNRDKAFIEQLLSIGFSITVTNIQTTKQPIQLSPLHMASKNDKGWQMVQLLIEKGPTDVDMLNFQDTDGFTPMHIASQHSQGSRMIRELLKHKADISVRDKHGRSPLHHAAMECIYKNIEVLLDSQADVSAKDASRKTPLHYLVAKKIQNEDEIESQSDSVKRFLENGADVVCVDKDGNSPIHAAAASISNKSFQQLLARSGDVPNMNNVGLTPLHLLLGPDTPLENVKLLVETYPSLLECENEKGKSVLHVAFQNQTGYNVILYLLREKCIDHRVDWEHVDVKKVFSRFTSEQILHILQYVTESITRSVMPSVMHVLCDAHIPDAGWRKGMEFLHRNTTDVDLDVQDCKGSTALHKVADSPVKMDYLIKKKCNVNIPDHNGNTPLHIAVEKGNAKGVDSLLSARADVSALNTKNETALLKAAKMIPKYVNRSSEYPVLLESTAHLIECLLFNDISKNVPFGYQPTGKCSDVNISRIISSLVGSSSPVNVPDKYGNTAVHYAVFDINILKQLVSAKANLEQKNNQGMTCLHIACISNDNTDVIGYLLDNGMFPCTTDTLLPVTPLHIALLCKMNDHNVLKKLYDHLVTSSQSSNKDVHPYLHVSACFSSKDVVQLFINLDKNQMFTPDKCGYLPIHHAVAIGDLEVVMLLAEAMKTAKPRSRIAVAAGQSPQNIEESASNISQSAHLGPKTTDVRATSSECKKHKKMKDLPEEDDDQCVQGKPQAAVDSHVTQVQNLQALMCRLKSGRSLIVFAAQYRNVDVIGFLLQEGWGVNHCDENGNTPLHAAVKSNNPKNVEYLLAKGASVECFNRNGLTPSHTVVREGPVDYKMSKTIIRLLLNNGASVTSCTELGKQNMLHLLCKDKLISLILGHVHMFNLDEDELISEVLRIPRLLIYNGCDVNATDSQGQTPLHLAAEANNALYVDIFLDNGGCIDALDNHGRTPLQLALENRIDDLIPLFSTALCLVERGAHPHAIVRCGATPLDVLLKLGTKEGVLMNEEFRQICHLLGIWEEVKVQ